MVITARKNELLTDKKNQKSPSEEKPDKKNMSINLAPIPPVANAKIDQEEVVVLKNALSSAINLPTGTQWDQVIALNLNILPDNSAVLNVRFKQ